ncbi:MAG: cation:proton antiporter, partial [Bacteroidales bacterium]|nr:cation:proton antiporter [Bacteroidales bacterium]
KSMFFIYIGISMQFGNVSELLLSLLLTAVIFAMRIPVAGASTGRHIPLADKSIMAIMVPKGLAAAVLASIPAQMGVPGGETIRSVTYAVVLFSIIFTSVLAPLVTRNRAVSVLYGWLVRVSVFWRRGRPAAVAEDNGQNSDPPAQERAS